MRILNAALLCAALSLAALSAGLLPGCSPSRVGQAAPNVTFVGLDDQQFDLASLRGRTVLLNFWFYH